MLNTILIVVITLSLVIAVARLFVGERKNMDLWALILADLVIVMGLLK